MALNKYDKAFRTITFLSTPCHIIKPSSTKVILIGGGKDNNANNMPNAEKKLKAAGTRTALLFDSDEHHFMFAYKAKDIVAFLNQELSLSK